MGGGTSRRLRPISVRFRAFLTRTYSSRSECRKSGDATAARRYVSTASHTLHILARIHKPIRVRRIMVFAISEIITLAVG